MVNHRLFHDLLLLGLLWLCMTCSWLWLRRQAATDPAHRQPVKRSTRYSTDPKPFPGLTTKPRCAACEQAQAHMAPPPGVPPPLIVATRGRRRQVATQHHFCPNLRYRYYGWVEGGNLRANGHLNGGLWRQLHCITCRAYFLETHGTLFHGKCMPAELLVRVVAALAEGLGIRAVARVFEVDPNTVLQWLVEAADQLEAFSRYFLHDVQVNQVQLDELFAVLSAVKAGQVSDAEALQRLEHSPHWVWVAIDPVSKLLLAIDVGERTLAMAQHLVHLVVQVLARGCVPLFITDGLKDYATALLTYFGSWVQPPRRQAIGPAPKPRWMPLPELLYAQVMKQYRRHRMARVRSRVVFGALASVKQVLVPLGWQINTAFIERVNLTIRHHVAAAGRRVMTVCKSAEGLRHQLSLYQTYHNFRLPHASLCLPLPRPEPTNGNGSAKRWRPRTPAMAARGTATPLSGSRRGRSDQPPWPQPQGW